MSRKPLGFAAACTMECLSRAVARAHRTAGHPIRHTMSLAVFLALLGTPMMLARTASPSTESSSGVGIDRAVVRGALYPAAGGLRTISRLYLSLPTPHPKEVQFVINPGRRLTKILGPDGQALTHTISSRRLYIYGLVYSQVTVTLPDAYAEEDPIALTFFLDGGVTNKGFYKFGDFLNDEGIAALGDVLVPQLDIYDGPETDDFLWLELELNAPAGWVLGTAGSPMVTEITDPTATKTHTELTADEFDQFLGLNPSGMMQHYWKRIGINAGLFYLNGGKDWTVQRCETAGVRVGLYTSRGDSAKASVMLGAAEKMIPIMQESYGPFPFKDLSLVISSPGHFGGGPALDSWSMATFPAGYISWDRGSQQVFAHELIHQYWNQSLRVPFKQAKVLCEPFASYLDSELWARAFAESLVSQAPIGSRGGHAVTYWLAAQAYREQPAVDLRFVLDPFANPGLYDKGTLGVAMLADLLGPENFKRFQHELFSQGDGRPYNIDSLQSGIASYSKYPCDHIVRDIFAGAVHYDYGIDDANVEAISTDSCRVAIRITRKETGEFPMLLRVSFANSAVVTRRIEPRAKDQIITVEGPTPFRKAELDPEIRTLDCNWFDNAYPRLQRFLLAWGRRRYDRLPYPAADWGNFGYASRRFYLSPVLDCTDFDGYRAGIGLETRMAYRDKKYVWATWSEKHAKIRGGAGWFFGSNVKRTKIMAHYHDDGLVREAILTVFGLAWRDRIMLSPGMGYEERPSAVAGESGSLRYAQSAPSFRLGLTLPHTDYLTGFMLGGSPPEFHLLTVSARKAAAIWGANMDFLQVEGDSRFDIGRMVAHLRWGLSNHVNSEGEGFALGGRWGYADDRVRMVRGYDLGCYDRFVLLNAEYTFFGIPRGSLVLLSDLAHCRAVGEGRGHILLGYGVGLRYWLPWANWLESVPVRIDVAAPKEGLDKGRIYIGVWSAM